jgi:hypothetical protein
MGHKLIGLLVGLALSGCAAAGERQHTITLRVTDPELRAAAESAAERIGAAAGVLVLVSESHGVPVAWGKTRSGKGCQTAFRFVAGVARAKAISCVATWGKLAEAERMGIRETVVETMLVHEVIHALAPHVSWPFGGWEEHPEGGSIMHPHPRSNARINAADLEHLCELANCTRFEPEQH